MTIFIGDKPNPKMKPGARPFEGTACEPRLNEWLDYLVGHRNACRVVNSDDEGVLKKALIWGAWHQASVVALGTVAASRLNKLTDSYFKLPHPSGLNRQVNDKEFITKKLQECKDYIESKT